VCTSTLKTTEFKRRLRLSVLSVGSRRSSLSEFQALGPATANARRPYELRCIEARRGNDAWQNEDVVDWPHRRLECIVIPWANYEVSYVSLCCCLQRTPKVDFSSNAYYEPLFEFYDQRLLQQVEDEDTDVHQFFRLLALCHTVMPAETDGNWSHIDAVRRLKYSLSIDFCSGYFCVTIVVFDNSDVGQH